MADMTVRVKPLVWEDADQGMCTKWRAAALGGQYELVAFSGEDGFAVNFYWGRPLSYWFIQGDPDEWGPTGPKMFPTLEAAKAAAQADYEARVRACLGPAAPTVAEAARVLLGDDASVAMMARAVHDGPLMASEHAFDADTQEGVWCVDVVRAALQTLARENKH